MSFTTTKDRIWIVYDTFAGWLARRSEPLRKIGYWVFGSILWIAYFMPRSTVRATFRSLSKHVGRDNPRILFRDYVNGFMRGMNRTEQLRHGYTDAIDEMLKIPEQARLDALVQKSGVVLVIPHTHGSIVMGRALAQQYRILALIRTTRNTRRAASETQIFENMEEDFVDVRHEKPAVVARKILKALSERRLIIGMVDRIRSAPPEEKPIDTAEDLVRAQAFGEPIGIAGWPARFAWKAKCPILPVTVDQSKDGMSLVLGNAVAPTENLSDTTQAWVTELESLIKSYPDEWAFSLDKHWSRILQKSKVD